MTHPLISRLTTEIGWPSLSHIGDVTEFTGRQGVHCPQDSISVNWRK